MGRYTPGMGHERRFPGTSVNGRPKRARECLLKARSADRALARRTSGTGRCSPHMIIRSPRLQLGKFVFSNAKRLLQHGIIPGSSQTKEEGISSPGMYEAILIWPCN